MKGMKFWGSCSGCSRTGSTYSHYASLSVNMGRRYLSKICGSKYQKRLIVGSMSPFCESTNSHFFRNTSTVRCSLTKSLQKQAKTRPWQPGIKWIRQQQIPIILVIQSKQTNPSWNGEEKTLVVLISFMFWPTVLWCKLGVNRPSITLEFLMASYPSGSPGSSRRLTSFRSNLKQVASVDGHSKDMSQRIPGLWEEEFK